MHGVEFFRRVVRAWSTPRQIAEAATPHVPGRRFCQPDGQIARRTAQAARYAGRVRYSPDCRLSSRGPPRRHCRPHLCGRIHIPRSVVVMEEEDRQQTIRPRGLDTHATPMHLRTAEPHHARWHRRGRRKPLIDGPAQCFLGRAHGGLLRIVVCFKLHLLVHAALAALTSARPIFIRLPMKVLTRHSSEYTPVRGCVRHA